jgi:septum formation protein
MKRFDRIYLVSQSPRRRELLKQIGVTAEVLLLRCALGRPEDVDETPLPKEPPLDYARRIAAAKVETGWQHMIERSLPQRPMLGADTTVTLDGEVFGKPADRGDAIAILRRLSGRRHQVITAVAMSFDGRTEQRTSVSEVEFRPLDDEDIRRYVASGEPMDKAGAYGIQGRAAAFIANLSGSYSGVMGLPLFETAQLLDHFEVRFNE